MLPTERASCRQHWLFSTGLTLSTIERRRGAPFSVTSPTLPSASALACRFLGLWAKELTLHWFFYYLQLVAS